MRVPGTDFLDPKVAGLVAHRSRFASPILDPPGGSRIGPSLPVSLYLEAQMPGPELDPRDDPLDLQLRGLVGVAPARPRSSRSGTGGTAWRPLPAAWTSDILRICLADSALSLHCWAIRVVVVTKPDWRCRVQVPGVTLGHLRADPWVPGLSWIYSVVASTSRLCCRSAW